MGKTVNETNGLPAVDLFGFGTIASASEKTPEKEVVSTPGDVEVIDQTTIAPGDEVEEIPETVPEGVETPPVETPVETPPVEETPVVEETPAEEVTADLNLVMQDLVNDDVLVFDENKEYDQGVDGLKQLIGETNLKAVDTYKESLGDEGREIMQIIESGGSLQDYFDNKEEIDFSSVALVDAKGDAIEVNQENIVEDWLKTTNLDQDEIDEKISDLKKAGLLAKEAKTAKRHLTKWQVDEKVKKADLAAKEKADLKATQIQQQADFKRDVLALTEVGKFKITKAQAAKLHEHITKPVGKNGESQLKLNDTDENRMLYAYMSMIGFDKDKLETQVRTTQSLKLKKHLDNYTDKNSVNKSGQKNVRNEGPAKVNIPWAFGK